jgi:hypothetical protein
MITVRTGRNAATPYARIFTEIMGGRDKPGHDEH